jgi:hypothetical protein
LMFTFWTSRVSTLLKIKIWQKLKT